MSTPPSPAEGLRLYQALLQGAPTAPLELARAYLDHLVAWLASQFPGTSPDLCEDAAVETLHELLTRPGCYRADAGTTLLSYLHMAARRDLLNVRRREARHAHEPLEESAVALGAVGGNSGGTGAAPVDVLCRQEEDDRRQALVRDLRAVLPVPEQAALDLLLGGEQGTQVLAGALGLTHLAPGEQEAAVKRFKDRVKVRLKRWEKRR